jgi:hypothetical protein
MTYFLKSKLAMFFTGIYALLIFYSILEAIVSSPHSMKGLAFLILTAPWSFLVLLLFDSLGIVTKENYALLYFSIALGGLMNASILYLFGCLLSKALTFLSSPSKR